MWTDPFRPHPDDWDQALETLSLDPALLPLAESLASFAAGPQTPESRQRTFLICLLVLAAQAQGHSGLPLEGPDRALLESLAEPFHASPDALLAHLDSPAMTPILGAPGERKPLIRDHGTLTSERVHRAETRLAAAMAIRAQTPADPAPPIPADVLTAPMALNPAQVQAVQMALTRPLTLITGGPGTGKTAIVVAILRAALRQCGQVPRVALAAPTGKAANRMHRSIQEALAQVPGAPEDQPLRDPAFLPRTLHRLLGYSPAGETWRHHEENPLAADLAIIDESSMVDLLLMDRLLRALPPGARLVLLGDADQLPSVETGNVFHDLITAFPHCVVRLATNYRMGRAGRAILTAARKIAKDLPQGLFEDPDPIRPYPAAATGSGVDQFEPADAELGPFLLDWLNREIEHHPACPDFLSRIQHVHAQHDGQWDPDSRARLDALFAHAAQARILCPLKTAPGLRGSDSINDFLHAQASAVRDRKLTYALSVSLGEPVMMTRNDHRRGIYNGDQGLALKVSRDGGPARLEAVFPSAGGGYSVHAIGPILDALELGYALTVHKAQGSEFSRVAIVLPKEDSGFLTREILYTALTRAKASATLLGSQNLVARAADRALRRNSGLACHLAAWPSDR
jgi:exodeoxyribonuclease V alpha subunit